MLLARVPEIRERLRHAVVRDGDGLVAPAGRGLYGRRGVGQRVQRRIAGVQVELHALFARRVVLAQERRLESYGGGLDGDVAVVAVEGHIAPDRQPVPDPDFLQDRPVVVGTEVFRDLYAPGIVGDREAEHSGVVLGDLAAVLLENDAGDEDRAAFRGQIPYLRSGGGFGYFAEKRFALRRPALLLLRLFLRGLFLMGEVGAYAHIAQAVLLGKAVFQKGELPGRRRMGKGGLHVHGALLARDRDAAYLCPVQAAAELRVGNAAAENIKKQSFLGHFRRSLFRSVPQARRPAGPTARGPR